ncbi:ScpA family protein [Thermomicrobium sp. 4228-Ro]|uniref:segregation and condensation protein A n=1 Tax=Thermomicrobium sp. 4228-Ro TaxID=2993937 RepID=UPI002248E625|nr:ScpA family protein [Thermomicrobium sp. 4228-Ro]MCX2727100.1 ScpA family protein [Thermomicrobium sp. 4228-Ro]
MRAAVLSAHLRDIPVTVGDFSGPLDLLLQLVQARELPITAVSLQAVTEQFLATLEPIETAHPELLADFLVVASRLTALKARALLPRPEPESPDTEDPLVVELRRYRAFREAAEWLRTREASGWRSWTRPAPPRSPARLVEGSSEQLRRALVRWARRCQPPPLPLRLRPVITLTAMIERFRRQLQKRRSFRELLGEHPTRSDVAVGLLALLTLARRREIDIEQPERFGEIWVRPRSTG